MLLKKVRKSFALTEEFSCYRLLKDLQPEVGTNAKRKLPNLHSSECVYNFLFQLNINLLFLDNLPPKQIIAPKNGKPSFLLSSSALMIFYTNFAGRYINP